MKKWLSLLLILAFLIGFVAPLAQPAYATTEETTYEEVAPSESEETIPGEEIFEVDPIPNPRDAYKNIPIKNLDANGVPAVTSTPEVKWIDRLDNPPSYVRALYDWLAENSDGDGVDDALIDPTTLDLAYNQYYTHTVVELKDLQVTYSHSGSNLNSAGSAAVDADKEKQKAAFLGYLVAAYAAFSRDYAGVFWFGGTGYYLTIPQSATYEDQGGGKGVATYGLTFTIILQEPGYFDVREEGYRDPAVIYNTIRERDSLVKNITAQATGTRYEKIRFLNSWLTAHNGYNTTDLNADLSNISCDCHNCMNALRGRAGTSGPICEGYARAMKMLCDGLEIPCVLVDGTANGGNHMWNYVQMEDGKWYAVDVTWNDPFVMTDNPITGAENENYLLIGKNTYAGGKLFSASHVVENNVYDKYTKFINGPVLADERYDPTQAATVTGIAIKTMPAKTTYWVGEALDTTGLALTVTYSDGDTKIVNSGFTTSGFSSATVGDKTVTVTYQGKKTTFRITVQAKQNTPLSITGQPKNAVASIGASVTFTVTAQGEGLSYQWKYKNPDADSFSNTSLAGNKTASLTVSNLSNGHHGRQYLCVITDAFGSTVETEPATLQVAYFVTDAKNQTAEEEKNAIFAVAFSVTQAVTYQWQYRSSATAEWANTSMTGAKTDTLTVPAIATRNGYQYRCKVTVSGMAEPIYSKAATLTVTAKAAAITSQPKSATAQIGDTVTFTVKTQGGGYTYKWQYRNAGATSWNNTSLPGYNTATLTVANVGTGNHGRQYRCIVTAADGGTIISEAATLTVLYLKKDAQTAFGVPVNSEHKFTVEYSITEGVTYQWQYKGNTSSSTWANTSLSGNKTNTLTVKALSTRNGYSYRCIIKYNGQEIISKAAILYVATQKAIISKQPVAASAICGDYATFTIETSGEGIQYQWQWYHEETQTWVDTKIAGHHTNTLQVKTNNYNGDRLYRCRLRTVNGSGWNEVFSDAVKMTVLPAAEMVKEPKTVTVKAGQNATFHVEAKGEGLTYQWQWAKSAGSWMNTSASGATTDTLTIANVNKDMDGRYYRVVITNAYGGVLETKYVRLYVK